jgi:preprotein translocase SecE subunit
LDKSKAVAEKLDDISVSEEEFELETEAASAQAPEAPGGEPPKKTKRGMLPPGGGGRGGGGRGRTMPPGFFARTAQFVRDTRAEMRRVSWPTATEVKNTTIITLIAVIFFALYLFGIDRVWAFLIDHLRTFLGG